MTGRCRAGSSGADSSARQGGAGTSQMLIALGVVIVEKSGEELVRH